MSHPKYYERTYFHARSQNEHELGQKLPRHGNEHRTFHTPQYDDLDCGYGVNQSRGSRRPGGYGWKPAGQDEFISSELVGAKKERFNGIRPPVHLISSPQTATHDPSQQQSESFIAMPQNMLNARNTRQLAFTTQRAQWDNTYGGRPSTTPTLRPLNLHPGLRQGDTPDGAGGRPFGPQPTTTSKR